MLKKYLILICLSLLALHVSCGDERENGGNIDTATIEEKPQKFLPEQSQPVNNILIPGALVAEPLADAIGILGLTATDLVRPLYYEEGYIMLARLAVVDRVADSPFTLRSWADRTSQTLKKSAESGLLTLASEALKIIDGYSEGPSQVGYQLDRAIGFEEAYRQLCQSSNHEVLTERLQEIKNAEFHQQFDLRLRTIAPNHGKCRRNGR